jgi:hypothetical protein
MFKKKRRPLLKYNVISSKIYDRKKNMGGGHNENEKIGVMYRILSDDSRFFTAC